LHVLHQPAIEVAHMRRLTEREEVERIGVFQNLAPQPSAFCARRISRTMCQ
jgi:hypothetical protein